MKPQQVIKYVHKKHCGTTFCCRIMLYTYYNICILECGPMPNVMVALALPNTGGALCSMPQSLA